MSFFKKFAMGLLGALPDNGPRGHIAYAVDDGSSVQAFDTEGNLLFLASHSSDGGLQGYTNETVSVQDGNFINVYDPRGAIIRSYPL